MIPGFKYVETETPGVGRIHFSGPSPFAAPMTSQELTELCARFEQVLLLGVFTWSNWSGDTARAIYQNASWFSNNRIGLAIFTLDDPNWAEQLCPGFLAYYMQTNADPIMLLLDKEGKIQKGCFGPIGIDAIKEWIVS